MEEGEGNNSTPLSFPLLPSLLNPLLLNIVLMEKHRDLGLGRVILVSMKLIVSTKVGQVNAFHTKQLPKLPQPSHGIFMKHFRP